MIIYNTTYHVEDEVHDDYITFVREEIIPRSMSSGLLTQPQFARIHSQHEERGVSYSLQFRVENLENLERWMLAHGQSIQGDLMIQFGTKVAGFMTLLEEVEL